jgi:hypothetical protein
VENSPFFHRFIELFLGKPVRSAEHAFHYTAMRRRLFARRRARVLLPPGVFILVLNPCDLARLCFFGLYVNDMMREA